MRLSLPGAGRWLAFIFLLFASAAAAEPVHTGKVVRVAEGRTVSALLTGDGQMKVRLASIDTPERGQPFGRVATRTLAGYVAGKQVEVEEVDVDRYGRVVGHVYADGGWVNGALVRDGVAWVYRKYSDDPQLLRLEREAREEGRGLWVEPDPVPPWEWRRR